jgi:hypothetical protein
MRKNLSALHEPVPRLALIESVYNPNQGRGCDACQSDGRTSLSSALEGGGVGGVFFCNRQHRSEISLRLFRG